MFDVVIIGGGIVGLATGHALLKLNPSLKIIIFEKEQRLGQHQTGHNSGVIHSGIYYKPGSLKAKTCRRGIDLLLQFCDYFSISYDMCGKIIIATDQKEISTLSMLMKRGQDNGIRGLKMLSETELKEHEPYATGLKAIYCPETGIIDYLKVCQKLSLIIMEKGEIVTGVAVQNIEERKDGINVFTKTGNYKTQFLINCAGLYSDQISELAGIKRQLRIIPFRGEYFMLKNKASHLVKNLIYPVPNPLYPFLGVHFTRTIAGDIEAGPNAVLAWAREGYNKYDFNAKEIWDYLSYIGFWRMARKYWSTALFEYYRSNFKFSFVKELQKLVPDIKSDDILPSPSGVRAQALDKNGNLIDDFVVNDSNTMIHVINAPSPAATSALAIGEYITGIYSMIKS
ncbi:MAG: L-2-hydroxyglutarate oxidase [Candidatus Marinimicrobia bacterium]|nr:L-2-hydroxyglutarate oxidase [Candidatus Neomarinimicrobiota bacterium]|tara:strand:- start:35790 stop:36983 length:1194 start_codon:yes stop_codon:yes gene_type:complete